MIYTVIYLLIFVLAPAFVLWLCKKINFLGKIGPILILYILGVLVGQIPGLNNEATFSLKDTITTVMIPLALPMMLFGCSFNFKDMKGIGKSLLVGIAAVLISTVLGYLLFGHKVENGPQIAGLLVGCETGGTINMAALKQALHVSNETYVLLNSYDMLVCFLYFIFLLSVGIKWFRKILPHTEEVYTDENEKEVQAQIDAANANPYAGLWSKSGICQIFKVLLAVVVCIVLSALVVVLTNVTMTLIKGEPFGMPALTGGFGKGWFMPVFILSLTTFSLAASFLKPIKKLDKSYDIGLYLIYVFSIAVASMADVTKLNFGQEIYTFLFLIFIIFASLLVQVTLSKLFNIDSDMMVVTSVSLINSPPFVPMMVTAMKNKKVLVPGITVGIIGFAVGNYLGVLMCQLFSMF